MTTSEHKLLDTQHLTRLPKHDYDVEELVIASLIKFEPLRVKVKQAEPWTNLC